MKKIAPGPVDTTNSPHATLKTLPFFSTEVTGGFWEKKRLLNGTIALKHGYKMLKDGGTHDNFIFAAHKGNGEWKGHISRDSDIYKWLEAAAYHLALNDDPEIASMVDESVVLIVDAQEPDGYLHTSFQYNDPGKKWTDIEFAHEIYNTGHLIQAAIAFNRLLNDDRLLVVARKLTDLIYSLFGPGKREAIPGHPEVEMALVELYRETGESRYIELANLFIDRRGHKTLKKVWYGSWYYPDRVPIREAKQIEGHAVRAVYFASGVADAYAETGEKALMDALVRQWEDMVNRKMYVTGGIGSWHDGEAFGEPYYLPNDRAYCETCAAIGSVLWNWRMLLATGETRFADIIERTLYNGVLSGFSLAGNLFYYTNPLLSSGIQRQEWYPTACCPPNIMRLIASIQHYIATLDGQGVSIHQYVSSRISADVPAGPVSLSIDTDYPWRGNISVTVEETPEKPWPITLRVPEWCGKYSVSVNGEEQSISAVEGKLVIERKWRRGDSIGLALDMQPRLTTANPRVEACKGKVAIEHGPIVFCFEDIDQPEGVSVLDAMLDPEPGLEAEWRDDTLGGVMTVKTHGLALDQSGWEGELYRVFDPEKPVPRREVTLTAVPYHTWANRGRMPMRVWIPLQA